MPTSGRENLSSGEFREDNRLAVSEGILRDQIDSVRREFNAGLTTAGVQIGAVEKTLKDQISSLKLWGAIVLISGQTIGSIVTTVLRPDLASHAAQAISHFLL